MHYQACKQHIKATITLQQLQCSINDMPISMLETSVLLKLTHLLLLSIYTLVYEIICHCYSAGGETWKTTLPVALSTELNKIIYLIAIPCIPKLLSRKKIRTNFRGFSSTPGGHFSESCAVTPL